MPSHLSINLLPVLPRWLIVLLGVALFALLIQGSLILRRAKQVPAQWVAILAVLRIIIIIVFLLALLEPVLSYTKNAQLLPDLLVLVDTSKSMGLPSAAKGASPKTTRLEETVTAFRSSGAQASLEKHFNIHWFAFDRTARPIGPVDLQDLKAEGETTRYADSISAAWDYQRQAGSGQGLEGRPERALLITDGRDLGQEDAVESARDRGITLDTMAPAVSPAVQAPARTTVSSVQSPRRILLGSEARFVATLRHEGAAEPPMALSLVEGGKTIASQDVILGAGQAEQQVVIAYRPTESGVKQYEVRLAPKGADKAARGDPYRFSVEVLDAKNEVLVLEDNWRWDFKFIRRVLEDDPSFSYTAMLSRGGNSFVQYAKPDSRVHLGGFPQTRAELSWFDEIILGDPSIKLWPKGLAASVSSLVREEGRSLIVIAGPNLSQWRQVPELYELLPVELAEESAVPLPGPIDVQLTPEGAASPFFFKPPKPGVKTTAPVLPELDQIYPPMRKRPAATVLVEAAKQGNSAGHFIVMAEQTVGKGRVLFIATDTLWKWDTLGEPNDEGLTPGFIFWQQAFRAMAPARPSPGGVNLTVQPDHSRFEAGQPVTLSARVQSDRILPAARLQSTVVLPNDQQIPLNFIPDPAQPQIYKAQFDTSLPGQYRINTALTAEGKTAADVVTAIDVDRPRAELSDTTIDIENLRRIAAMTGGKFIVPSDPGTWPSLEKVQTYQVQKTSTLDLWNNFTLMLLLCALLALDWGLRLVRGYM